MTHDKITKKSFVLDVNTLYLFLYEGNTKMSVRGEQGALEAQGMVSVIEQSSLSVVELIQSRRSIRDGFTDEPVDPAMVYEIIQGGLRAPSSKNAQPWRVHILHRGPAMSEIADAVQHAKGADSYVPNDPSTGLPHRWESTVVLSAKVLKEVGVGLFIENRGDFSGGKRAIVDAPREYMRSTIDGYSFEMVGMGAMIQNMWLTAYARGLRGVFMGDILVAESTIKEKLGMEGDLVGVLALGHSKADPFPKQLREASVVDHGTGEGERSYVV